MRRPLGALTAEELAILQRVTPACVSIYTREWEETQGRHLLRRGVSQDLRPTLTHKKLRALQS